MPTFEIVEVTETPYLYVDRNTSMDGDEIGQAMHSGFAEVWGFMEKHGVAPAGSGLSVYYDYAEDRVAFRVGFAIARDDMAAAEGPVKADVTPAGRVLHFTVTGSYAGLRPAYEQMMTHMQAEGLQYVPPTWEFYLNDPNTVPEDKLVTECYQAFAA
jgi:effector-binding domain-containing protein